MRISALSRSLSLSIVLPACGTDWDKSDCLTGEYDDLGNCLHVICADGEPSYDGDCDGDGYTAWEDCDDNNPDPLLCLDQDGDGFRPYDGDCNDLNAATHVGAPEWCDEEDNDCDGVVDEEVQQEWFADTDGDGAGDPTQVLEACDQPAGYSLYPNDCDDTDAEVNGSAVEICDGIDNDCDGWVDDDDSDLEGGDTLWFEDADEDGYGNPDSSTRSCFAPTGYVTDDNDCDDTNPDIHPNATEVCDADDVDEDCDGLSDDADPTVDWDTTQTWWVDLDGDGFGHVSATIDACDPVEGYSHNYTDCDDSDPGVNPDAREVCDELGVDENCDGVTDAFRTWYADMDSDGYGDPAVTLDDCDQPTGYIANYSDCDDGDSSVNPGATEVCDADDVDEDCDGLSDDADSSVTGTSTYYIDSDGDSYGDASAPVDVCDPTTSQVVNSTDCDDANALVHPGAVEVCDSSDTDDDCDGLSDDADPSVDAGTYVTFYIDSDGDGYGDGSSTTQQCDVPSGYSGNASDCNDGDATISPAATEVCDSADVDEDCDGLADDADSSVDTSTHNTFYADTDADGYGDSSSTTGACDQPSGFALNGADCDDADSGVNPGATEVCDSADLDEDCNGFADDADSGVDTSTHNIFFADTDGDGYGGGSVAYACDEPSGYTDNGADCNDADSGINPGASEICDTADTDEDCNGFIDDNDVGVDTSSYNTFYTDADFDGYGDLTSPVLACDASLYYVADATDCDDTNVDINPAATEVCDALDADEDCDGLSDDDDSSVDTGTFATWYADSDLDGYGDAMSTTSACDEPSGYTDDNTDCDDTDASVISYTYYEDADGDGYGDVSVAVSACTEPSGYVADATDCDDTEFTANPASVELKWDLDASVLTDNCDGIDSDCDGTVDEGCTDTDGDGLDDGEQPVVLADLDGDGLIESFCFLGAFDHLTVTVGDAVPYWPSWTSVDPAYADSLVASLTWGGNTWTDVPCVDATGGATGTVQGSIVNTYDIHDVLVTTSTPASDLVSASAQWQTWATTVVSSSTLMANTTAVGVVAEFTINASATELSVP
jgi:hypothetical protein